MSTPPPRRAYHAEIHVGADTLQDLADELRRFADRLDQGPVDTLTSGSPSAGGYLHLTRDPDMTHDRYHAANREWLDERRAEATR